MAILSILVLLSGISVSAEIQPIAFDHLNGALYMLNADGTVVVLKRGASDFTPIVEIPKDLIPSDMVSAERGQVELLVIARMRERTGGRVLQYSPDGNLQASWDIPITPGNADIDTRSNVLYVTGGESGDIYRLELKAGAVATPLIRLADVGNLGPLIFVQATNHLFAADIFKGKIFDIDVPGRTVRSSTEGYGQVTGMALDPSARILYVADAASNRIISFSIATRQRVTEVRFPSLRQITCLASSRDANLWVGDYALKAVFEVSSTGQILSRVGENSVQAVIPQADDNLRVLIDGQEVMSWTRNGANAAKLQLGPGSHSIELRVFNQRSYTGGIPFLGGHVPEGWNYQFRMVDVNGRELVSLSDREDAPNENGPRFGKEFTVARFTMDVSPVGTLSVRNLDRKAWQH